MFDNKVPAHFNRSGRFQNFSNKSLRDFYVVSIKSSFFYVVSMKPNESYRFVTFYYSNVVVFCDFYHVCANVNKDIC